MRSEEHKLQSGCVKWFRLQYPSYYYNLFAIPNGGVRDKITGLRLKEEGVVAGVADMFLAVSNMLSNGMFIEFKVNKNKQTDSQKTFEKAVVLEKYRYEVVYDFDTFYNLITEYMEVS